MANDDEKATVLAELRRYGLKPSITLDGRGHHEISWQVAKEKPVRSVTVANTGSDWRGRLNARADVRRLLRQDNAQELSQRIAKPSLASKILSTPPPTDPVPAQLIQVRVELDDMMTLLMEISRQLTSVLPQAIILSNEALTTGEGIDGKMDRLPVTALDLVPLVGWVSTDTVARKLAITAVAAYQRLKHLASSEKVEQRQKHFWRRLPSSVGEMWRGTTEAPAPVHNIPPDGDHWTDQPKVYTNGTNGHHHPEPAAAEAIIVAPASENPSWWPKNKPKMLTLGPRKLWDLFLTGATTSPAEAAEKTGMTPQHVSVTFTQWKRAGFLLNPHKGEWRLHGAPEPAEKPAPAPVYTPTEFPPDEPVEGTMYVDVRILKHPLWAYMTPGKVVTAQEAMADLGVGLHGLNQALRKWCNAGLLRKLAYGHYRKVNTTFAVRPTKAGRLAAMPKPLAELPAAPHIPGTITLQSRVLAHPLWRYLTPGKVVTVSEAEAATAGQLSKRAVNMAFYHWTKAGYLDRLSPGIYRKINTTFAAQALKPNSVRTAEYRQRMRVEETLVPVAMPKNVPGHNGHKHKSVEIAVHGRILNNPMWPIIATGREVEVYALAQKLGRSPETVRVNLIQWQHRGLVEKSGISRYQLVPGVVAVEARA